MDVLLQTLGVLAAIVIGVRLLPVSGAGAFVPACLGVAAALSLAPFPANVRSRVQKAEKAYDRWAPLTQQQADAASFPAEIGIPTDFVVWFRARMKPGEAYFWAAGAAPAGAGAHWFPYHHQWITYRMLPFLATADPQQADAVMLYNLTPRQWQRRRAGQVRVTMFSKTFGIARPQ